MKYPKCEKQIMSFLDFYLWSHPFTRKCKKCRAKIQPDSTMKKALQLELILGIIAGLTIYAFVNLITIEVAALIIILTCLLIYPIEKYAWNNGKFIEKENRI